MKKILAMILALVLMLSVLTACGGKTEPTTTTNNPGTSEGANTDPVDDGKVYTINIDYPNPENSAIYPALVQWAEYVNEKSNGRIDARIYSGGALGSLFDCVSNCEAGVTDGFWSGVTIYAGVFPATEVLGLPMLGSDSQYVTNAVMNALITETELFAKDWENFHVVALHSAPTSPIIVSTEIAGLDDLRGLDLRISNAYTTDWFSQLGINPTSSGINDGYENIQKGVIKGGLYFFDQVQSSALYEVISSLYLGETISPLTMFCLNKDVYEGLPADLQAIIDESGEYFLSLTPDIYNAQQEEMLKKCEEYGVTVVYETPETRAALMEAAQGSWVKWVEQMNSNGLDGQAILDTAREYIEKYNEIYAD